MIYFNSTKKTIGLLSAAAMLLTNPSSVTAQDAAHETGAGAKNASIGIPPEQTKVTGAVSNDGAPPTTVRASTQDWRMGFHGFLRAPFRTSFDKRQKLTYPMQDGVPNKNAPATAEEDVRFNMAPALPDTSESDWKFTNSMPGPWAELIFSFGNSMAVGNVAVATHNITDSGWRNLQSQLGINQAWLTLDFPKVFGSLGGLEWNVGIFANRYGHAGRYDAGRYDTYLIGRTHIAGETLTAKLNLTEHLALLLEHGFGAKSDVLTDNPRQGLERQENPSLMDWIPFGGDKGQYPTMVHHGHAGLVFHSHGLFKELMINGHFMHAFTKSADTSNEKTSWPYKEQDAKLLILGAEVKLNGSVLGDAYLGFSTVETDGLNKMSDAVELLHSRDGYAMVRNFYGNDYLKVNPGNLNETSDLPLNPGTGRINTIAWQYMFSLSRVLWHLQGKKYSGYGPDFTIATWGMLNIVKPDETLKPFLDRYAEKKLKLGLELMYTPIQYLGIGVQYDRVVPDMDYDADEPYNDSTFANPSTFAPFHVIGPKLRVKTAFVTREEVNIQYSRYIWNGGKEAVNAETPHAGEPADRNALMISVNMWW